MVAISRWPKVPKFASAGPAVLPAPALSHLDWRTTDLGLRTAAAWTRRPLAPGSPVATANDVTAGQHAGRTAGSSGEPFQDPGIGAPDPAGPAPAQGGGSAGPFDGSLVCKGHRQISPPRRRGRNPAIGVHRTSRAIAAKRRRDRAQAGGASQAKRAIGSGRRVEEALTGGSDRRGQDHQSIIYFDAVCPANRQAAQFVTILAMQSRMTMARNSKSI